jgi:hypothetical protein|tara:strand:+ start:253 stop:1122 length:870 start_codon:yes stop_codon:yes gene_type:complete
MTKFDDKLKGLPPIFYLNMDHRTERKEHLESEFSKWGITDYTRVSANRFHTSKINEWGPKLDLMLLAPSDASIVMNEFWTFIDWYNSGISENMILIQDDLALDLIEYWPFDWNTLYKNLPYNWDIVQFYYCHNEFLHMHLSPQIGESSSAACILINRNFVEKLMQMHLQPDGSFKLANSLRDVSIPRECYSSDDWLIYQVGKSYTLPILCLNQRLATRPDNRQEASENEEMYDEVVAQYHNKLYDILATTVTRKWWESSSHKYSADDILSWGSPIHHEMKIVLPQYEGH